MSRDFENFEGKAGRQTGSIYFSNRGKRCLNRISSLRYELQYTGQNAGAARRRFTALPSSRQMTKRYFTGKHVLMDIHRRENWFEELKEQVSVPQGIILSLSSSFPAPSHLPNCHAVLVHLSVWSPIRTSGFSRRPRKQGRFRSPSRRFELSRRRSDATSVILCC